MQVNKVLVAVHGGESDSEALWLAHTMTREAKGKIHVVYVIEVQRALSLDADMGNEGIKGEDALRHIEGIAKQYHCKLEAGILRARDAGPALVQEAVDLEVEAVIIAVPYKMHHGVFSLGDTVPYVLENTPCPVLLLRGDAKVNGYALPPTTHR